MPIGLFATNRWETNEVWYPAGDVIRMLDRYVIDHAYPSWPVNRWLTTMLRLFRTEIESLLLQRDRIIQEWAAQHPGEDVFEDRSLDMTGIVDIDINTQVNRIQAALDWSNSDNAVQPEPRAQLET
jgi:hypothetical protein